MNSVKNYFSPTKLEMSAVNRSPQLLSSDTEKPSPLSKEENEAKTQTLPKPNSRKIISNMESVINSVKKRHRHRKKKENNETNQSNPEITDISNILSNSLSFISPNTSRENVATNSPDLKENVSENANVKGIKRKSRGKRSSLTEKDRLGPSKLAATETTDRASQPTEKSVSLAIQNDSLDMTVVGSSQPSEEKSTPKMNAFTFMMNARNRSIGSNDVGKDVQKEELLSPTSVGKAKRKLMLQDWAEKKGGAKRKLEDAQREEYVDYQMGKRAKRLKRMLLMSPSKSGQSSNIASSTPTDTNACISISLTTGVVNQSPPSRRKQVRVKASKQAADDLPLESSINGTKLPKQRKKRTKRISSTESEASLGCSQDSEFVKKLSSPIKKRDSLLGYFPKIVSPTDNSEIKKTTSPPEIPAKEPVALKRVARPPKSMSKEQVEIKQDESPALVVKRPRGRPRKSCPKEHKEHVEMQQEESPRGRPRKSCPKEHKEHVEMQPEESLAPLDTPTSRPRRSCVSRPRYDEEFLYGSPEKSEETLEPNRPKRQKPETLNGTVKNHNKSDINCDATICLDITDESMSEKTPRKLAPLFIKSVPKPAIDPAILQARKNFLMSGIPEKMKLEMAKQKQFEEVYEISLESMFPKISHVGHDSDGDDNVANKDVDWEKCGIAWHAMTNSPDRLCKVKQTEGLNPFTPLKKPLPTLGSLDEIENKVDIIKSLKVTYDKFPTYRCYKQLRAKYRQTRNLAVQQVSDSFVILNTNTNVKDDGSDMGGNGELLFTEKYKPITLDQVLVNFHPVNQLKDFLLNFQNGKNFNLDDSSNDFDVSNDSISMGSCNSVVLHGPSSSGKTNAVFALANELNFNVLEINAGMKRNGKKLLQELQEATQSHLVKSDKPNLLKRTFSGLKGKDMDSCDSSSASEFSSSAKLSLILVEDADIVFDQDSGFIDALHQLVGISKRPVVIVSNKPECPHLARFKKQSRIEFTRPNIFNISKFLSVMSLVENCPIELDDIIRLYLYNKLNLRRTILEMQFFIQSGGDRVRVKAKTASNLQSPQKYLKDDMGNGNDDATYEVDGKHKKSRSDVYTHQTLFDFYTINQNSEFMVQYPLDLKKLHSNIGNIFANAQSVSGKSATKRKNGRTDPQSAKQNVDNSLDNVVQFYENLSVASHLTSLEMDGGLSENLGETIAHSLVEKAIRVNLDSRTKIDMAPREKSERTFVSSYLPQNWVRTNRSVDLDYEPALRSICRTEKFRSQQERRGSRFYHYLRNICTITTNFGTNEFDKICHVLEPSACDDQHRNVETTTT